jgi:phage tail-like protein
MPIGADALLGLANRFHLKIIPSDKDLGTWNKADGLDVSWEVCEYRAGDAGNERWYFPGNTKYQTVKLTRAACTDSETVKTWLSDTSWKHKVGMEATLTLFDSNGAKIIDWNFRDIMPVKWSIQSFDAGASKVALETLELAHMGFLTDEQTLSA